MTGCDGSEGTDYRPSRARGPNTELEPGLPPSSHCRRLDTGLGMRPCDRPAARHIDQHQLATDGIRARLKYETLSDHLSGLLAADVLPSDRFKSTAAESYTFKNREGCLNPEPVFSPPPPADAVSFIWDTEQRLARSSLPASRPRCSETSEAFRARQLLCAGLMSKTVLPRQRLSPVATDILPRHVYTAKTGVFGQVNPLLSTTSKDYQPVGAESARRYRDAPPTDTFSGDKLMSAEPAPQPRWQGPTPSVPHGGLRSEVQQRYVWPSGDQRSQHTSVHAPFVVPPTGEQLLGEPRYGLESDNYGTGRHNPVALSCSGQASQQRHQPGLCTGPSATDAEKGPRGSAAATAT